ncbi:MAG: ChuX/HutX family heme-like substrate-binding protein, partial [Myxococcota bacterium]
ALLLTEDKETVSVLQGGDWVELITELGELGRVMALTRNENVVIEKHGHYQNVEGSARMGMVLDDGVDLRLFFSRWKNALAVRSESRKGPLRSIQFFDEYGEAIHKVYVFADGEVDAFEKLVERRRTDTAPTLVPRPVEQTSAEVNDASIDVEDLRAQWSALRNTHDFYPMLARFGLGRRQAMRLAGEQFARPLAPNAYAELVKTMAEDALPFMAFVGNPGCIQIHSGVAKKIVELEAWFNVFDPDFNLHVKDTAITECWAVRKPTEEHGDIWSVEAFDDRNENVLSVFGLRKRDNPDSPEWMRTFQGLVENLR